MVVSLPFRRFVQQLSRSIHRVHFATVRSHGDCTSWRGGRILETRHAVSIVVNRRPAEELCRKVTAAQLGSDSPPPPPPIVVTTAVTLARDAIHAQQHQRSDLRYRSTRASFRPTRKARDDRPRGRPALGAVGYSRAGRRSPSGGGPGRRQRRQFETVLVVDSGVTMPLTA